LSDCPVPVKTDVGQVDLVLRLSDGRSEKIRDSQIYFHWYKILGLLYKRALFDLQFVHNLFWFKLKWNARSKLFYIVSFIVPPCFGEVQGHWQNYSRNLRNALMKGNINIWNIRTRITPERTLKIIGYQFGAKFKLVFCTKYDRGLDLCFWEILKPLKWTNITSFFLIWLKRCTKIFISVNLNKILCFRHLFLVKKIYLDTHYWYI
jgi:hypothetical protein